MDSSTSKVPLSFPRLVTGYQKKRTVPKWLRALSEWDPIESDHLIYTHLDSIRKIVFNPSVAQTASEEELLEMQTFFMEKGMIPHVQNLIMRSGGQRMYSDMSIWIFVVGFGLLKRMARGSPGGTESQKYNIPSLIFFFLCHFHSLHFF